ncbi:hypothetical protein Egran_06480 [Elaphomyces granulatus]|uniref:Uncharacterized protein n=1 Tax=Elaphomyces granulatus TaxID=519963 RepID=A0A232LNQ3_9EURO|nr:hypothetical protein Egran_06480 [Elaphomyces granulatus]
MAPQAPVKIFKTVPASEAEWTKAAKVAKVHRISGNIKAIAECKQNNRRRESPAVDMQEVAQIVAWIKEYPNRTVQRILLSQDRDEIYISFAEYDNNWETYLCSGKVANAGFMVVNRFGPWRIGNVSKMRHFAEIILAFSLK